VLLQQHHQATLFGTDKINVMIDIKMTLWATDHC